MRTWLYLLVRQGVLLARRVVRSLVLIVHVSDFSNIQSIWKESCPPSEETPTKAPAASMLPSLEPISSSIVIHIPTLVPLAKPTLPTIKDAVPFIDPISVDAAENGVTESVSNDKTKEESLNESYFQSDGFLAEWASSNSANFDSKRFALTKEIVAAFFLRLMLRILI